MVFGYFEGFILLTLRQMKGKRYVKGELLKMENANLCNEEYLTLQELCNRIGYKEQSIYNKTSKNGEFTLGEHYLKPSPKKLLFRWSKILEWIGENSPVPVNNNCVKEQLNGEGVENVNKNEKIEKCRIFI